jgi:NADH-quinone oxidoreductase subunit C
LPFEQLIDLCGVDYSEYSDGRWEGPRYCVVSHLLSVSLNQRVRLKVFCANDDFAVVASVNDLLEFGQLVRARGVRPVRHRVRRPQRPAPHPDRLRLHRPPVPQGLPDLSGHVEMRYDAEQRAWCTSR